jgi:hypothetical protein
MMHGPINIRFTDFIKIELPVLVSAGSANPILNLVPSLKKSL